MPDITTDPQ